MIIKLKNISMRMFIGFLLIEIDLHEIPIGIFLPI